MDQDRQPTPRASNRSCVAHRRADLPEKGLRSSQHVPARTTDVSASSPHEATQPITFNRRCLRPRSSNHGCPWIQKSSERTTVMLGGGVTKFGSGSGGGDSTPPCQDSNSAATTSNPRPRTGRISPSLETTVEAGESLTEKPVGTSLRAKPR